jgi:predicted transposase/invertase (TIGR01784 family)
MIPEKLSDEPFRKAFELANRANMTKEEWEAYDAASVIMQDQRGMVTAARKEGRQEGKQEGKQEVARSMRQKGFDPNLIAELTGLSVKEIEQL